jgi:hypothetical protein
MLARGRSLLVMVLLAGAIFAAGVTSAAAAGRRIVALSRSCSNITGLQTGTPTALTEPLDPALLTSFAVLRRPAGPQDALPPINSLGEALSFQLRGYLPAYIRLLAEGAGGEHYFLVPGFARAFRVPPARCLPRALRRVRARLVAEQRKRESEPVYCIAAVGPSSPRNGAGEQCLPFSTVQSGAGLIATETSTSPVVDLVPDGVATVRLTYRSGEVISAAVSNNAFTFTPPQGPITKTLERLKREGRELERMYHLSKRQQARLEQAYTKLLQATIGRLPPKTVQWLGAGGQPIRSFSPHSEHEGSLISIGALPTSTG